MKKLAMIFVLLFSMWFLSGCDGAQVYYDQKSYEASPDGGELVIEMMANGVYDFDFDFGTEKPWLEVKEVKDPNRSSSQQGAHLLEAPPPTLHYVVLDVKPNETGRTRTATLIHHYCGDMVDVPVDIVQKSR